MYVSLCDVCQFVCYHCYVFVYIVCMHMRTHMCIMYKCIMYTCVMYRIEENVGGRKHWKIKIFSLFGGENIGEYGLQIQYRCIY